MNSTALFISGVGGLTRASVLLRTGRLEEATGAFLDLVRLWRSTGAWVQQWITLRAVAELLVERGSDAAAALVIGAVRSSDATEISGLDAERLSRIAAETERRLPDAEILFARGATIDAEALVDEVIDALAELAAS